MEATNLFCDHPHCGKPAQVFGVKGFNKEKRCGDHMFALTSKKMTVYDISGYHFISSCEDVPVFEERRNVVEKGLGNLTSMESQCDADMTAGLDMAEAKKKDMIETVERCFEEIQRRMTKKYQEIKESFKELRYDMEQYLSSKAAFMQDTTKRMCDQVPVMPNFLRISAIDTSLAVAEAILGAWSHSDAGFYDTLQCLEEDKLAQMIDSIKHSAKKRLKNREFERALEDFEYASKLGLREDFSDARAALQKAQAEESLKFESLFQMTIDENRTRHASEFCLKEGIAEKQAFHYSECLNWLQSAWNLLQRQTGLSQQTVAVGMEFGMVLSRYFGKYQAGEEVLKFCVEVKRAIDPRSEEMLKLNNTLAECYWHSGKYPELEVLCQSTLTTFADSGYSPDHFWLAIFFLGFAYWEQEKTSEVQRLVEEWAAKKLQGESPFSEMIQFVLLGRLAQKQGNYSEAEKMYNQAKTHADQHFPTSLFAAVNLHLLGDLYSELLRQSECEELYHLAKRTFEIVAPHSLLAGINLRCLAVRCRNAERFRDAEQYFKLAQTIFEEAAPDSIHAAHNFYHFGLMQEVLGNSTAAYSMAQTALNLYAKRNEEAGKLNVSELLSRVGQKTLSMSWIRSLFSK